MFAIIEDNGRFYLWYNGLDDVPRLVGDYDSSDLADKAQSTYSPTVVFDEDFV